MTDETITDLDMTILSHFRRDTLCGKCGGPMEKDRVNQCWRCDVKTHVRAQLDWIDTASMNLAIKMDIQRPPAPVRIPPPVFKSDESDRKKPTRKKRARGKLPTKRKSTKKTAP